MVQTPIARVSTINSPLIYGRVDFPLIKERRNGHSGLFYTWFHMICWHYPTQRWPCRTGEKGNPPNREIFKQLYLAVHRS